MRGPTRVAVCALLSGLLSLADAAAAHAQVDPGATYRTLETSHFRVTYEADLEDLARHAAARAEVAYAVLARTLTEPPDLPIDIVVADDRDLSNGAATPLPSNRIWIWAKPPVETPSLAFNDDWIDLVITHELAHSFHLDAHGPLGSVFRRVFGRVPFTWPVFPALGTPLWSLEGLAVQVESALTGFGRIHGTWHDAVVRTAVLAGEPDPIDRVSGSTPIWPGNERVYIYGSLFLDWVRRTYGDSVPAMIVNELAEAWLPPGLFFDRIPRAATGQTFTELYAEWLDSTEVRHRRLADSLRAEGITGSQLLTTRGYRASHPRFSLDATRVAYAASDGRSVTQTRIIDPEDGHRIRATRRNSLATIAWLPDGGIITSQLEWQDPARLFSDLYLVDAQGREHRLTDGARLQDPDVTRDGSRIIAIANDDGRTSIVLFDYVDGSLENRRTLVPSEAGVQWALPRFSPLGDRIAVSRSSADVYQVVIIDTTGTVQREVTQGAALDMGATFSPDGRWLVFSSDRSGIANLYAADLVDADAPLRQVTNVLGGAYAPDVAPDGNAIVYSEYRADGFHIARIPFEPGAWRTAPPATLRAQSPAVRVQAVAPGGDVTLAEQGRDDTNATMYDAITVVADTSIHAEGPYRPWHTLRPYYWLPLVYTEEAVGTFVGASSYGTDVVGKHQWSAAVSVAPENGRTAGAVAWTWAGWRNPQLTAGVDRDWDRIGFVRLPQDTSLVRPVVEREDVLTGRLSFIRQRTRSSLAVRFGGELVRRSRTIEDGFGAALADPTDDFAGVITSIGLATSRAQPFSISREDGISLAVTGRRRWDRSPDVRDATYTEITTSNALYQSLDLPGFARHVIGVRASGLHRTGSGAAPSSIGGASGILLAAPIDLGLGPGTLLLPVRGFPRGIRAGTSAWTASAEYRFPIAAVGRGVKLLPLFLDRVSGALFVDAGDAWCSDDVAQHYVRCDRTDPGDPLLAAGAELNLDLGLFGYGSVRTRLGAAAPIQGPGSGVAFYLRFGHAF